MHLPILRASQTRPKEQKIYHLIILGEEEEEIHGLEIPIGCSLGIFPPLCPFGLENKAANPRLVGLDSPGIPSLRDDE